MERREDLRAEERRNLLAADGELVGAKIAAAAKLIAEIEKDLEDLQAAEAILGQGLEIE